MEFNINLSAMLIILGLVALIIEATVLGFSSFILFFLGFGLLASGFLMTLGILPEGITSTLWSVGIFTAVFAMLLWKPLKTLQNRTDDKKVHQDFTDRVFELVDDVDLQGLSEYSYSGVRWKLKSQKPLVKGTLVTIERAEVGVLWVSEVAR